MSGRRTRTRRGSTQIISVDRGLSHIIDTLKGLANVHIEVGVLADNADAELLIIASANEYGTQDGHVPERSYMRSTLNENQLRYQVAMKRAMGSLLTGSGTIRQNLSQFGELVVADVKRKIVTLREPPNAASTIKQKGSDNPLIDTGRLLNSITFALRD